MCHIESANSRKSSVAQIAKIHVLDWYLATYPDDTQGASRINPSWTFGDILAQIATGGDTFSVDTDVREVIFSKLAQLTAIPYTTIYDLWLFNTPKEADDSLPLEAFEDMIVER